MTLEIPLSRGLIAIVDVDVYDYLMQWKWFATLRPSGDGYYAVARINGESNHTPMHHLIVHVPEGMEVDHKDGNGLNNVRSNLRVCTHQQNLFNRRKNRSSTTGYKGVTPHRDKFQAQIGFNGKNIYLGLFPTAKEAHEVYVAKARELFGDFANINNQ
jgi:hypothetical protein